MSHSICIVYITCEMPAVEKGSLMQPMLDHDRCRQTAGFFGKAFIFLPVTDHHKLVSTRTLQILNFCNSN